MRNVPSHALPEDICIAVRGHQGWSRDPDSVATYALVGQEIPIYEPLRAAVDDFRAEVEGEVEAEVELETPLEIDQ